LVEVKKVGGKFWSGAKKSGENLAGENFSLELIELIGVT